MHYKPDVTTTLRLHISTIVGTLAIVGLLLVGLGIVREFVVAHLGTETPLKDLRHFALDAEHALPAYFSALLLGYASALLFAIGRLTRQTGGVDNRRWLLLAVIFLAMSVDEAVSFHEVLIEPLRSRFNLGGIFYFSWVIPGAAAVLGIALYLLPLLRRLPRATALLITLSGAVYVGGALGLELLGGVLAEARGMQSPTYLAVAIAEETLEIAGATLFVAALLGYLRRQFPGAQLGLVPPGHPPASLHQSLASRPARSQDLAAVN